MGFFLAEAMVKDAYYFLTPVAALVIGAFYAGFTSLAWFGLLLAAFLAFFFRDPSRQPPGDPNAVVSPADGKIIRLDSDDAGTTLSIFLSPFDVHVSRAPIAGVIVRQEHRPGKFRAAFDRRASVENERMIVTISGNRELTFALIAGVLARRIVVWKREGDHVSKGDKIGLIRFGSRVDLFFPSDCELVVNKGDRVRGGSSVIGYWRA